MERGRGGGRSSSGGALTSAVPTISASEASGTSCSSIITSTTAISIGILPELGVFDLPFLFANEKEADTVLDGEFGKHIDSKLETVGLVNLAYWENGFRNLTNSRRPVEKWEDFKGLKVRVMQNNVFLDTFKNMGANAVPMAFGEVFTALETKAIDGQENPFTQIYSSKLQEVQKYLSLSGHVYTPAYVTVGMNHWKTLPADVRKILEDTAKETQAYVY